MNNDAIRVIEGTNVDLICPFPLSEVKRMYGWLHCYRTVAETDDSPKGLEENCAYMTDVLQRTVSWGMIDKNHLTNIKHEAPLVGFGVFEPTQLVNGVIRNGFLHVGTARRAWKARLVDEATEMVLRDVFEGIPTLLRLTAVVNERNAPAKALLRRAGFKMEGIVEDGILVENSPQNLVLYGLTRRNYNKCHFQQTPSVEDFSDNLEQDSSDLPQPPKQVM